MEKRKLRAIVILLAAYVALTVGLAYAVDQIAIGTVAYGNITDANGTPIQLSYQLATNNATITDPTEQPLPDSANITLYHVGFGYYKWAQIELVYNTGPTQDVTWEVQLYIYEDTDGDGALSSGDRLVSISSKGSITIAANAGSGSTIVELYPPVHYRNADLVELVITPPPQ